MIVPRRTVRQPAPPDPGPGGTPWRLVTASMADASTQMALDQALAEAVWGGTRPATLRLYHWPRPALTIGRHQHPAGLPCPAVRRLTGGRAIFHEDELTFSVALPAGHPLIRPTIAATYRGMAAPILHALAALGLNDARPAEATAPGDRFACFAAPTRGEAMLGASKLMGLAQWIGPHGLLAQGSIPLTPPTRLPGAGHHPVTGLARALPGVTRRALERAVLEGFATLHGAAFSACPPDAAERRRTAQLARRHYAPVMPPPP